MAGPAPAAAEQGREVAEGGLDERGLAVEEGLGGAVGQRRLDLRGLTGQIAPDVHGFGEVLDVFRLRGEDAHEPFLEAGRP